MNENFKAQDSERKLMKFNKEIRVTVSVDSIAERLLEKFKEDEPHRVLLTEQIVGILDNQDKLSGLYNALNGYENVPDFKVGQLIEVDYKITDYLEFGAQKSTRKISVARIKEINIFREYPITYEFWKVSESGKCELYDNTCRVKDAKAVPEYTEFEEPVLAWKQAPKVIGTVNA